MIITSHVAAKAGNKVKTRSAQSWPGLAYSPGANMPINVAHFPGDILVLFISDYNWMSFGTPSVTGPGAPVWNYLEGIAGAGGVFWARATSSTHSIGVIDPGGGSAGTWYAAVGVFGGSGADNPIGGFRYGRTTNMSDAEVPAITLADTSGNSQIFSAFHGYGVLPTSGGAPGYTTLDYQAWTAPNTSVHGVGAFVKGDTTSDGAVNVAHTDNGVWSYVNACTVEIVGGFGTPTSLVDTDTIQTDGSFIPVWTPPVQQPPPVQPPPVEPPPAQPTPITITSVTNAASTAPLWSDPLWYINGSGLALVNMVRTATSPSSPDQPTDASIVSVAPNQVVVQNNLALPATSTGAALYVNGSDGGSSGWFTFPVVPAPVVDPGPTEPPDVVEPPSQPTDPQKIPHDPVITTFGPGMAQNYTVPDWAHAIDIVCLGGGGGGQGGGALQSNGEHGEAGSWGGITKQVNLLGTNRLLVTVGGGGDAGRGPLKGVGTDGRGCTVSDGTNTIITVAGGRAGATGALGGFSDSPPVPPYTFHDVTYPGTPGGVTHDPPPAPAGPGVGGTGGDGNVVGGGDGGAGGPGKVWIRAYQLV